MDNTAPAPERAAQQAPTSAPPSDWVEAQNELAASSGLALLLVEGRQPPSLAVSNNNSICHAFQTSPAHAHRCEPFCGVAYERALKEGGPAHYRCHAGLHCFTMPVRVGPEMPLAVIGGRGVLRSADYRALAERIRTGDLTDLLSADLFRNVVFALRQDLDDLAERFAEAAAELTGQAPTAEGPRRRGGGGKTEEGRSGKAEEAREPAEPIVSAGPPEANVEPSETLEAVEPVLLGRSSGLSLKETCNRAVGALSETHGINSLALMLRADDSFFPACTTGAFGKKPPRVSLKAKEIKLLLAATRGESIAVPAGGRTSSKHEEAVELFPLVVGDAIKGALLVADRELSDEQRKALSAFCREMAMPLEVIRLRDELERRMRAATHLQAFTEVVNTAEPEEAYSSILRHSAELLRAERGSLLLFDESAGELAVKASLGPRADISRDTRMRLGDVVAGAVMSEGRPVVMRDVAAVPGWSPAPSERSYKTNSFISYPIMVGGRKVGVLNVTDKAGGGTYDE